MVTLNTTTQCTRCGRYINKYQSHDCSITAISGFDFSAPFTIYESMYHGQARRKKLAKLKHKNRMRVNYFERVHRLRRIK